MSILLSSVHSNLYTVYMSIMIQQYTFDIITNIGTYPTTTLTVSSVPAIQPIIRY